MPSAGHSTIRIDGVRARFKPFAGSPAFSSSCERRPFPTTLPRPQLAYWMKRPGARDAGFGQVSTPGRTDIPRRSDVHDPLDLVDAVDFLERRDNLVQVVEVHDVERDVDGGAAVARLRFDILDVRSNAADRGGDVGQQALAIGRLESQFDGV